MCRLKSGIILKDRIFVPSHDGHTDMLAELKLEDTHANAETLFVRAELSPADSDVFTDPSTWVFRVDQDIRPDWFVEEYERERFVEEVRKWWEAHVFIGKDDLELSDGNTYYLKDCKRAVLLENATVTARGNSTVTARGNSTVTAWGNSTVTARGNSTVTARGNSTCLIENFCFHGKRENILVLENSTLKDCSTRTIWQAGDFKIVVSTDEAPKEESGK